MLLERKEKSGVQELLQEGNVQHQLCLMKRQMGEGVNEYANLPNLHSKLMQRGYSLDQQHCLIPSPVDVPQSVLRGMPQLEQKICQQAILFSFRLKIALQEFVGKRRCRLAWDDWTLLPNESSFPIFVLQTWSMLA